MLTQEDRKKVESQLRQYFEDKKAIATLESKKKFLERQEERIEEKIKNYNSNICIEPDLNMGIGYGEKVQTSSTGISYAESSVIKGIDRLLKKQKELEDDIDEVICKVASINQKDATLESILEKLNDQSRSIIEETFQCHWTNQQIGAALYITEQAIRKRKKNILDHINKWLKNLNKI